LLTDIAESEPNTCAAPQSIACGDRVAATLTPGDTDHYRFTLAAATTVSIWTERGAFTDTDTFIHLFADDGCVTQLASDDDSATTVFSLLCLSLQAGSYVIRVRHTSPGAQGEYRLALACPRPVNPTCATALPLGCGPINLAGTTACAGNDYNMPTTGCTSFGAAGSDVVYRVDVPPGTVVELHYRSSADAAMYVVTDCGNLATCIGGADAIGGIPPATGSGGTEHLTATVGAGTHYVILDNRGIEHQGSWTLTGNVNCTIAVEPSTWSGVKTQYRLLR
jgi:hypothetical protein